VDLINHRVFVPKPVLYSQTRSSNLYW
jgi:hypothetical protein